MLISHDNHMLCLLLKPSIWGIVHVAEFILSISVFMRVSYFPVFFMLRPLFYPKQDTMMIYSFHTWTLVFISWFLVHYRVCILELKIGKIHCFFSRFLHEYGARVLTWRRRWCVILWTIRSKAYVLIWAIHVILSCSVLMKLDLLIPCYMNYLIKMLFSCVTCWIFELDHGPCAVAFPTPHFLAH